MEKRQQMVKLTMFQLPQYRPIYWDIWDSFIKFQVLWDGSYTFSWYLLVWIHPSPEERSRKPFSQKFPIWPFFGFAIPHEKGLKLIPICLSFLGLYQRKGKRFTVMGHLKTNHIFMIGWNFIPKRFEACIPDWNCNLNASFGYLALLHLSNVLTAAIEKFEL